MSDERDNERDDYHAEVQSLRAELTRMRNAEPEPKAKRLSLSEILAAHLDRMVKQAGGSPSAVTLKSNAKGDTQVEVTVRAGESDTVVTVDDAAAKCQEVYSALRLLFPLSGDVRRSDARDES